MVSHVKKHQENFSHLTQGLSCSLVATLDARIASSFLDVAKASVRPHLHTTRICTRTITQTQLPNIIDWNSFYRGITAFFTRSSSSLSLSLSIAKRCMRGIVMRSVKDMKRDMREMDNVKVLMILNLVAKFIKILFGGLSFHYSSSFLFSLSFYLSLSHFLPSAEKEASSFPSVQIPLLPHSRNRPFPLSLRKSQFSTVLAPSLLPSIRQCR